MGYVGNQTTNSFSSQPSKQDFTGSSGSSITLSHAVSSPEDISLYINHVRQEPTTSYTVAGTTVSFVGYSISATDDVYVTYNALALQTVVPPDGSVTTAKINDDAVTKPKIGTTELDLATIKDSTGTNTAMTIDSTGRILTPARPAFFVSYDASSTSGLNGIINFNTVHTNIGSHFDISNDRFVAPIAGLYHFDFSGLGSAASSGVVGSAGNGIRSEIQYSTDSGSSYTTFAHGYGNVNSSAFWPNISCSGTVLLAAGAWVVVNMTAGYAYGDNSGRYDPRFSGFLVG